MNAIGTDDEWGDLVRETADDAQVKLDAVIAEAVRLYLNDVGEDGCIYDGSCECFKCLLNRFAKEFKSEEK